jgi:hypothetical protein
MKKPGIAVDFSSRMLALGEELTAKAGDCWSMLGCAANAGLPADSEDNAHGKGVLCVIGAKRSWVPTLGEIVWEIPKPQEDQGYYAYVCRIDDGRQIGYVRVPDYTHSCDAVNVFREIIARFEDTTTAMVLDQVDNNGGSMFQMYALLGMLTDKSLSLPQHQITIDEESAAIAADIIERARMGDEEVSPERVAYARFVLSEKAAGRGTGKNPSNPVYLEGVPEILPAEVHYTKKIVVLINELTCSAGEFLAATLQDNKRATLFGQRTAGAGGCQKRIDPKREWGLQLDYTFTLTWTIARRTNGEYIENRGVHPDVLCGVTREDFMHEFSDYKHRLLATVCA